MALILLVLAQTNAKLKPRASAGVVMFAILREASGAYLVLRVMMPIFFARSTQDRTVRGVVAYLRARMLA